MSHEAQPTFKWRLNEGVNTNWDLKILESHFRDCLLYLISDELATEIQWERDGLFHIWYWVDCISIWKINHDPQIFYNKISGIMYQKIPS